MEFIESKGKSVDEAIFNGLNKLGLGIDEVHIEILHEGSKGLFGLGKSAVVRLTEKEIPTNNNEAASFLEGVFERMNIDAACLTEEEDSKLVKIKIEGKDTAVLIGWRGETLDALQYLTSLVINRERETYQKVMLDAENYRKKRELTLEKLARRLASNVIKSGKPVTLEPMNPYERRIMHATLQPNPKVETYSEGEEPHRKVVIKKKRNQNSEQKS